MKRIALFLALFCLGLMTASLAVAKAPPGKGKGKKKTTTSATTLDPATCKPKISVILKGEFVSAGSDSFKMDVKQANAHGRRWVGEEAEVEVDRKTKFRRNGHAELEDFEEGDWLNVQAQACKQRSNTQPANGQEPRMLAKRVVGKPAKTSGTTSTTTTTTASP
jgi:hypothetical protein